MSKVELLLKLKRDKANMKGFEFDNVLNGLEALVTHFCVRGAGARQEVC